ncbi:hypothetical protein D1BOALGB6SA_1909 [Olavius sp. associated proteobacterium Delta 1]|nr:hypothetical protein D1BOALGB6SA_1909 [Olavius sp. associated proteobacterium Delta 1]
MEKLNSLKNSTFLQKQFYRVTALLTKSVNHYLNFYCSSATSDNTATEDLYFHTSDGRKLPVLDFYRYSIKPGWKFFPALGALQSLNEKNLLSPQEVNFLNIAIGTRTLQKSQSDIKAVADPAIKRCQNLFFPDSFVRIPSDDTIRSLISIYRKEHKVLLSKLKLFDVSLPVRPKPKILEIGYISGGYSIFAFERLGFHVFGVDNYYGKNENQSPLPQYIKQKITSPAEFKIGDITRQTDFGSNDMDIIYSASVLEHLDSPEAAFAEMNRILKTGGLMIHGYNPFFCPNGGHALGILDSPWGHVRINLKDYLRYMDELRPFETEFAKRWITDSLNMIPIHQLQHQLVRQGFQILYWQQHAAPVSQQRQLTQKIMKECLAVHPGIDLADLITSTVTFAARKVSE